MPAAASELCQRVNALSTQVQGADSCNLCDLDEDYRDWLSHFLQSQGAELTNIYLGQTIGDLVRAPFTSIDVPVDFLIAGPPC